MTNELEHDSPPVLGYATPDLENWPDWHANAESLIAAGCGPEVVSECFKRRRDAIAYYGATIFGR
jgi:hypothetical protein